MKKLFPEVAAECYRFSCDEMLIETGNDWKETLSKLTEAVEKELPLLKDVVRIGAFKLIRYILVHKTQPQKWQVHRSDERKNS